MRAVIYVDTINPTLRTHQIAWCTRLAEREGYHVVETVTDAGCDQYNRPGWHTLRSLIEQGALDVLIVLDYTHLARQPDDLAAFLDLCWVHQVLIRPVHEWHGSSEERVVSA